MGVSVSSFLLLFSSLILLICFLCRVQDETAEWKEAGYNRTRGNDAWLGRMVRKDFKKFGIFTGRVDGVDDHAKFNGHRIFHVTYSDGDDEWIEIDELYR